MDNPPASIMPPGCHNRETSGRYSPFSLLPPSIDTTIAIAHAAQLCRVDSSQLQDLLPCTSIQEGLMALTTQRPGDYVATFIYGIGANVSIERLHQAWDLVAESNPILRTRIISLPTVQGHVLWQAVLDVPLSWKTENEGDIDAGPEHQMNLSEPLTRMSIIKPSLGSGPCCPYWKIHHALYDGWSINLFLGEVERAYYRQPESGLRQMQHFIRHLQARDESAEKVFWSQYFDGIRGAHFPSVPLDSHPRPDSQITFDMTDLPLSHCDYTGATIVTAAWATVAANEAGASEALFGLIVTGRQAPLKDIEFIAGPTIATVPKRVSLDWRSSHDHLLDNVQKGAAEMIPFEQTGLRNISRMSESAALACKFQTLLVIQPYMDVEDSVSSPIFYEMHDRQSQPASDNYSIVTECHLEKDAIHARFSYDSKVVSPQRAEFVVENFSSAISQLSDGQQG